MVKLQAQDYTISFAGAGASNVVDSVTIQNLTQGTSLTIIGGDQLRLIGQLTGIDPASTNDFSTLHIYPNPANEEVEITFEATANAKAKIELFDLLGCLVWETQSYFTCGPQSFRIIGLRSGIYTVLVQSEAYHYEGKIISRSMSGNSTQIVYNGQSSEQACHQNLKSGKAIVQMQYNTGDLLKFTGKSGIYGTVYMDVPTEGKTITFTFAACIDYDNNNYTIVQIGAQTWMAENLNNTHYSDGTAIQHYVYNNDLANAAIYGRLYSWFPSMHGAASSNSNPSGVQGVCPTGWHLPSCAEWLQLTACLGGEMEAGLKIKETGNTHWVNPNINGTNETGFTALPAGMHNFTGIFQWLGDHCAFMTSTWPVPNDYAITAFYLVNNSPGLMLGNFHPADAVSVRCVKD
jgi:uncharacterized protein (TIGR02145 family)